MGLVSPLGIDSLYTWLAEASVQVPRTNRHDVTNRLHTGSTSTANTKALKVLAK